MLANESTGRKSRGKKREPVVAQPSLSPDERQSLRVFVRWALGDGHLTGYEENFLNSMRYRLHRQAMWLTDKQQVIVQQIQDKLHYGRPDVPPPPIDPDGVEENDDPDGWPAVRGLADPFGDDDELPDWLGET
jgi:hypothetical protein